MALVRVVFGTEKVNKFDRAYARARVCVLKRMIIFVVIS